MIHFLLFAGFFFYSVVDVDADADVDVVVRCGWSVGSGLNRSGGINVRNEPFHDRFEIDYPPSSRAE